MSTPPPPEPPSGPPPGPLPGPPSETQAFGPQPTRPWWRRRPALIGAAAAVVAIVVAAALVIVLRGRGEEQAPIRNAAAARAVVKGVALVPGDWGLGYVRSTPYESDKVTEAVADDDCSLVGRPPEKALAALLRNAQKSDQSVVGTSMIIVHRDDDTAASDIARFRSDARRCQTETDSASSQRWEDVREVDVSSLKGFDELAAEEGHQVVDENGQKVDNYYTQVTGRKGQVLMQTSVARAGDQGQNRQSAMKAISLMLSRL
ncbi:hypothetical protein ABZ471_06815 [Streptomyces sp. NPDC005728]|uniref:hypothetical protein n=1 Tax=Streptomyces sp. NPDC005728 TaxID=3157054 RepID=UPI0033E067B8